MLLTGFSLLLVAVVGGLVLELMGQRVMNNLSIILAFGGAYIVGLCFLHLVPRAFRYNEVAGTFVIIGFLVQIILEYLSKGLEHGHVHVHNDEDDGHHHSRSIIVNVLPWSAIASLCIHALLESMPLAEGTMISDKGYLVRSMGNIHIHIKDAQAIGSALFLGLAIHKLPVAIVLMGLIKSTGASIKVRWVLLIAFGLMPILGMNLYDYILHSGMRLPGDTSTFIAATHGIVIGILLHVATTVLFESGEGHEFHFKKLAATILGLGIAYLTLG